VTDRIDEIAGNRVLFFSAQGRVLAAPGDINDFISEVWSHDAVMAVIPVSRLSPDFLKLSTRLAGETVQKFVNYNIPLVILGDVSRQSAQSGALRDYIYESNKGRSVWFLPDEEALRARLAA
jgi:Domain of unknown function (DUF4180)